MQGSEERTQFFAVLDLEESQLDSFRKAFRNVTTLGCTDENIPGRVSLAVLRSASEKKPPALPIPSLFPDRTYSCLIYQIQTVSLLCILSPFDAERKSKNYLPGERLLVTDDGDRFVEAVLEAEEEKRMEPDLLIEEEMLLRPEYRSDHVGIQKLKVMNRYRYIDFDTMTLDNYRISW